MSRAALYAGAAGLALLGVGLAAGRAEWTPGPTLVFLSLPPTAVAVVAGAIGVAAARGARIAALLGLLAGVALTVAWVFIIREVNTWELSVRLAPF